MPTPTPEQEPFGDASQALSQQLIYDHLRHLAHSRMRRLNPGATLSATEVVHEIYLRLCSRSCTFENRRHFFFAASRAMNDFLVDAIRRKVSLKRGGDRQRVELGDIELQCSRSAEEILDIDLALQRMGRDRPALAALIRLRYFGGLTEQQIAATLDLSLSTVKRRWRRARIWLQRELKVDRSLDGGNRCGIDC